MGALNPEVKIPGIITAALIIVLLALAAWVGLGLLFEYGPNQHTPHVSRVPSEMRTIATGLEAYRIDWSVYPKEPHRLTTPVAYLTTIPFDPYSPGAASWYVITAEPERYCIYSFGPDEVDQGGILRYDATNGTISAGDVVRLGPGPGAWEVE